MSKELNRISKQISKKEKDIDKKIIEFDEMYYKLIKDYPQYFYEPKTLKLKKRNK